MEGWSHSYQFIHISRFSCGKKIVHVYKISFHPLTFRSCLNLFLRNSINCFIHPRKSSNIQILDIFKMGCQELRSLHDKDAKIISNCFLSSLTLCCFPWLKHDKISETSYCVMEFTCGNMDHLHQVGSKQDHLSWKLGRPKQLLSCWDWMIWEKLLLVSQNCYSVCSSSSLPPSAKVKACHSVESSKRRPKALHQRWRVHRVDHKSCSKFLFGVVNKLLCKN